MLDVPQESFATNTADDGRASVLVDVAEKGGEGLWAGQSLGGVSGFQTMANTRALWLGGVDMLTDAFMNKDLPK